VRTTRVDGAPGHRGPGSAFDEARLSGATDTPRKTNYDFERRERERNKAAEAAKKAQAKADKKASEQRAPSDADRAPDE
jgi:hypothetical protein